MSTCTEAWSQVPVTLGSDGVMSTLTVGMVPLEEQLSVLADVVLELGADAAELDGQVATVPTEDTTPVVVWSLGRVMLTLSPAATSVESVASSATCTCRRVEVPCSAGCPAWA